MSVNRDKKNNKTHLLQVRISESDREKLLRLKEHGVSFSSFVRDQIDAVYYEKVLKREASIKKFQIG